MRRIARFYAGARWLRLLLFCVLLFAAAVSLGFGYNLIGNLYFGALESVLAAFLFGLALLLLVHFLRLFLRIPGNLGVFYAVIGVMLAANFFRWSLHVAWLRTFDWTADGLHPVSDFWRFMGYFWQVLTESRMPATHLVPDMLRFNETGWELNVSDFHVHLSGGLLAAIWALEFAIISGMPAAGAFLSKRVFLPGHFAWARFVPMKYPFAEFGPADIERLRHGDLEAITDRTLAEGDSFSQVALVYAGKARTGYAAIFNSKLDDKGNIVAGAPAAVVDIGEENVEKMLVSLKETHAEFFEKKEEQARRDGLGIVREIALESKNAAGRGIEPGAGAARKRGVAFTEKSALVEGFGPVGKGVKERRRPYGTR